ncbi:t-complex 1 subunit alpha [Brachionus plicatilis]|uniref:T-complex 1 subunit alpha n=1 Tax=Brachionus plicatilis TaxID=10195 RepID=A0A3M7RRK3_BRAPC|nr:t-complex 1 subunit alpha [Brachionus plicatilis]
MTVGWMPLASSLEEASRRAPAITTTVVVPSPASMSCALDSSTSILAAGWLTCICLRMVAPSLVMVTEPSDDWIILSMPLGPSDVRTASAIDLAAIMLESRTCSGLDRSLNALTLDGFLSTDPAADDDVAADGADGALD